VSYDIETVESRKKFNLNSTIKFPKEAFSRERSRRKHPKQAKDFSGPDVAALTDLFASFAVKRFARRKN
jgi:hypothetical protein